MKVIDLLNKIAKGEEVPTEIKYDGLIFEYQGSDWLCKKNGWWLFTSDDKILENLNDEVEIPEEDNFEEIKELNIPEIDDTKNERILMAEFKINSLIRNQKKIISKLDKE